jgi:sec-independent protein translocase protein TatA
MGGWEWAILVLIALLLIGGSRLAGIGRNAGKAVRAFKEETAALKVDGSTAPGAAREPFRSEAIAVPDRDDSEIVDAELIDTEPDLAAPPDSSSAASGDSSDVPDKA